MVNSKPGVRVKNCPMDTEHAPTQQAITRITLKTLTEWSGGIWFTSHWEKKFDGLLVSSTNDTHR